jgi:hypothetical protein
MSGLDGKRTLLVSLSCALDALCRRMRQQQENARKITVLAARAEMIAEKAWNLNRLKGREFADGMEAFVADVKLFAEEAAAAAQRAGHEALLGKEVADAIAGHAGTIAALAHEIDTYPDMAAVRTALRPLSVTLGTLPDRMKANGAMMQEIEGIGRLAEGLAVRGDALAVGGTAVGSGLIELSRELRHFAEEASGFSLVMANDAGLAVQAIETLSSRAIGLADQRPVSDQPPTAMDRLMTLTKASSGASSGAGPGTKPSVSTDTPRLEVKPGSEPVTGPQRPVPSAIVWGDRPGRGRRV